MCQKDSEWLVRRMLSTEPRLPMGQIEEFVHRLPDISDSVYRTLLEDGGSSKEGLIRIMIRTKSSEVRAHAWEALLGHKDGCLPIDLMCIMARIPEFGDRAWEALLAHEMCTENELQIVESRINPIRERAGLPVYRRTISAIP